MKGMIDKGLPANLDNFGASIKGFAQVLGLGRNAGRDYDPPRADGGSPNAARPGRGIGNAPRRFKMIHMRTVLAVAIFFVIDTCARATAIIATWTPDAVYIGADSMETALAQGVPPIFACKISVAGDVVVAHAGWERTMSPNGSSMWDIDMTIKDEFSKSGTAATHIENIEAWSLNIVKQRIAEKLTLGGGGVKISDLDPYMMELFFAYSDAGTMKAEYYIDWFDEDNREVQDSRTTCPGSGCFKDVYFLLGQFVGIRRVLDSDKNSLEQLQRADLLRYVIQKVSDTLPNHVGPPISVLKITPEGGREWIYPGNCH
ncbi:MAG TPA: hypothetical protein VFE60_28345 [Roseiarcus sp.]|jgi:hypothetical protein|nr:hypothetical protein [Roseiarcus sp.]